MNDLISTKNFEKFEEANQWGRKIAEGAGWKFIGVEISNNGSQILFTPKWRY